MSCPPSLSYDNNKKTFNASDGTVLADLGATCAHQPRLTNYGETHLYMFCTPPVNFAYPEYNAIIGSNYQNNQVLNNIPNPKSKECYYAETLQSNRNFISFKPVK